MGHMTVTERFVSALNCLTKLNLYLQNPTAEQVHTSHEWLWDSLDRLDNDEKERS